MSAVLRSEPFRPLTERDLAVVVAIEHALYEFPWTLGNFRDSLAAGYSCWSYRAPRELIGYAVMAVGPGEAHLLNLSIAAPAQRCGHGSRLLEHLIQVARDYGASAIYLEVRPSNAAARALYAQRGFTQIGIRKRYYPAADGREDALILSIPL